METSIILVPVDKIFDCTIKNIDHSLLSKQIKTWIGGPMERFDSPPNCNYIAGFHTDSIFLDLGVNEKAKSILRLLGFFIPDNYFIFGPVVILKANEGKISAAEKVHLRTLFPFN